MDTSDVIAFFSFAAAALNIALAAYVLYKNPRRRMNQLFALLAVSLAIWAFGDAMFNVSSAIAARTFWVRFQAPGQILFPAFFLHLALLFPTAFFLMEGRYRRPVLLCIYTPALFTLVSFYATTWVFRFSTSAAAVDHAVEGWLYWAYALFAYGLLLGALSLYVYNYYRSRRLWEKRIAQVMIAAVAIPLVINILENARLYTLSSAPCFFTITAAVFAYGILKHQLFAEVDRVLKRSIAYFAVTVIITSAYVVTIIISERFMRSYFSAQGLIITVLFVLAIVLVLEPLRGWVMKVVDRLFFRKDYQYGQLLSSFAETLAELSSLDDISRRITDTLTETLGLTGAALLYGLHGDGTWSKQTISGFLPSYLEGPEATLRLEDDTLAISRQDVGESSFEVLEIPLVFEREKVGILLLGEKLSGYDFSFSDRSLLAAMAPQMAVALKNGALYQEVLEKQSRVNDLMERVARAHEEERRRISRELHDGVAQSFLGVVYLSEFTLEEIGADLARARADLEKLGERARDGLGELRAVINDLRPIPLEVLGIKGAVEKLLNELSSEGKLEVELDTNLSEDERLPPLVEGNLYRIIQESLNNVRKHSGATRVRVSLMRVDGMVSFTASDNGRGIRVGRTFSDSGLGLSSMSERAEEMGGALEVESEEGVGTIIRVEVPLS